MNHVTIKRQNGKKLTVLRSISVTNSALLDHCRQYGPGVYLASWPVQQNTGGGKPRTKKEVSKTIYVYDDDCDTIPITPESPQQKAGLSVVLPPQNIEGLRAIMTEAVTEIVKPLSGVLAELKSRLDVLEADDDEPDDDEPDDDEPDDDEPDDDLLSDFLQVLRKPEYAEVTTALFMPATDEVKFSAIDAALAKNPNLAHSAILDVLSVALKRFAK